MSSMAKKTRTAGTPAAVIYLRVSTQKQSDSGLGIEAQETACRAHAARLGLPVLAVHVDLGISGKEPLEKRPGLAAALETVKANPGAVCVVYSLSRLARSQRVLWDLLDDKGGKGLPVASATEPFETASAMGRAMLGMLAVWSALEADMTSKRTKDALAAARERGTKLGAPTMVETVLETGERVLNPEGAALVRQVRELYASGEFSHRSLAEHLNARGVPSARGKVWHATSVRIALQHTA